MSLQALVWVIDHSEAEGNARCVMFAIGNYIHADGTGAWPSLATIAREARCSRATTVRAIAELRDLGELAWRTGAGHEGSRRKSNAYTFPRMRAALTVTSAHSEHSNATSAQTGRDKGSKRRRQVLTGEHRSRSIRKEPTAVASDQTPGQRKAEAAELAKIAARAPARPE